jgi:hypothetical protein
MTERVAELGRSRTLADGGRRYRPIRVTFDTRNVVLNLEIQAEWDDEVKDMWSTNKQLVEEGLLAELGPQDGVRKLGNYKAMGPEPWSITFEHTVLLRQVRSSFAHGDFYPALVGACALGERLLHQMVLAIRQDYANHPATTRRVRSGRLGNHWGALITVLHGWGVLNEGLARTYRDLETLRHAAVHFDPTLSVARREPALEALSAIQEIVEVLLGAHGGPPRYIADTPGASYLALTAEQDPFVKRILLPHCALVSPAHRLKQSDENPDRWIVFDDSKYPATELSDQEFAQRLS